MTERLTKRHTAGTHRLHTGTIAWVPASAVYLCWPTLYQFSTNGLASGNHVMEATLHALYEVLERDAMSRLSVNGHLQIAQHCRVVDVQSIDTGAVRSLCDRLADRGVASRLANRSG